MLLATVADQQVVAATVATISWQPTDSDGEPADPGAVVTVGVVNSAGTVVQVAGTATSGATDEPRTFDLTVAQTAAVDFLTATWSVGAVVVGTTVIEVVGRALISKTEFEAREPKASGTDLDKFLIARREVDDKFQQAMSRSWTPRFAIERISQAVHGRVLLLSRPDLREVRWARYVLSDDTVTAIDVTGIRPSRSGMARLDSCWPSCDIEIGYVHGADAPPSDVLGAAARFLRYTLGGGTSSIPERATIYTDAQGGVTQLATPGLGPFITGIPEVDVVLTARVWTRARVG